MQQGLNNGNSYTKKEERPYIRLKDGNIYTKDSNSYIVLGAKEDLYLDTLTFTESLKGYMREGLILKIGCLKYKTKKANGINEVFETAKYVEIDSEIIIELMKYSSFCYLDKITLLKRQMLGEIPPNLVSIDKYYANTYTLCKNRIKQVLEDIRTIQIGTVFYNKHETLIYAGLNKYGFLTFYDMSFVLISYAYERVKRTLTATNEVASLSKAERKHTVDEFKELMRLDF